MISNKSFAYDIEVNGFYFNVLSTTTLEVTYGDKKYSGDITIPSTVSYNGKTYNVVSVGAEAFAECENLLSIYMDNNISSIGNKAFYKCTSLNNYYFTNCKLGTYVFAYCTSLKNGDISGEIPEGTFCGCTSIESLSPKYRSIGKKAYEGCTSIKGNVEISGNVYDVTISESAFADCIGITKVSLKANVKMELDAFAGCTSLETIYASNKNADSEYTYVSGFGNAFGKCKNLKNVEIEKFGNKIFCESGSIYAKSSWGYYLNYVIPDISVYITPDWLPYINAYAFSSIGKLKRIILNANLKSIDINAFYNCPDLKELYCYSKTPISVNNQLYEKDIIADFNPALTGKLKLYVPKGCKQNYSNRRPWSNFIIEEFDVASFDPYAEYEDTDGSESEPSSEVEVGDVFEIDGLKYEICENNTVVVVSNDNKYSGDIVIPDQVNINGVSYSVTTIGEMAFSGCSLTSITMPNSVTTIGNFAFRFCPFTSVTIPQSVRSIGDYVFSDCSSLVYIIVSDGNTTYDSRDNCNAIIETASNTLVAGCSNTTIPNNVTSIGTGAFSGCRGFTSITIPNSVTSIGYCAFLSCRTLTTITIPNSVTTIGDHAFEDCRLTSLTIGNRVTTIGDYAFDDCMTLKDVYCYAETIPETTLKSFGNQGYSINNATLHVPSSSISAYSNTEPWSYFKEIVPLEASGVQSIEADNRIIQFNSMRGERLEAQSKGINIIKMKDGTTKKVLVK